MSIKIKKKYSNPDIYEIEVDGTFLGTIHLGSQFYPDDSSRVLVNIKFENYDLEKSLISPNHLHIALNRKGE